MTTLRATYILVVLLILSGCNKGEDPQEGDEAIVFSVNGVIDGESHFMEAGKENVYLYTSYSTDSASIIEFAGTFGSNECLGFEGCKDVLSIAFRDVDFSNSGGSIDSVVAFDEIEFTGEPDSAVERYEVSFSPDRSPNNIGNINWQLSTANISSNISFVHTYPASTSDIVTVCAELDAGTCQNDLCYPVNITGNCHVNFTYSVGSSVVSFTPMPSGQAPYTYEWDMGDGNGYVQSSTPPPFTFSSGEGWRKVCLRVTDNTGCIATHCKNIILDTAYIDCLVNFNYAANPVYKLDTEQFGTVIVKYRDSNGKEYRSDRFDQPSSTVFTVVDSQPYEINENGEPTTLIKGTFDCVLFGSNYFDRMVLNDMEVTFAVAHP